MTDVQRAALKEPRSLTLEQLATLDVTTPAEPAAVRAWIVWEDGAEELVVGQAVSEASGQGALGRASSGLRDVGLGRRGRAGLRSGAGPYSGHTPT